ncbi:hypothetical protein EI427_22185 [Flammeovirga pectinis]|uniref:Transglutaminase-like domain-containing protein n=1 Tax=Flammeovirga pectinis TaxID=2494373 RepID=A0A3Q9FUL4_9BACT|nr:transglutaminase domain-containing protein [Flammeovirga pectinis]AZQ64938.1 hypothetical protein EI427_22185 [Flammeovirga pectinis]
MIKYFLFCFLFFVTTLFSTAQNKTHVQEVVDKYASKYTDPDKLAAKLNKDFSAPLDRAYAAYYWVGNHIAYDVKNANRISSVRFSYSSEKEKQELIQKMIYDTACKTLKQGKGVCDGYAKLYQYLMDKVNVECVVVDGIGKAYISQIGDLKLQADHSWNAIKIEGAWQLLDATWGAGIVDQEGFHRMYSDIYFMTPPKEFFYNHYPLEEKWMLMDGDFDTFNNNPLMYSDVLKRGIQVSSPSSGVLKKPKNPIQFVMKMADGDPSKINYNYSNEKYMQPLKLKEENGNYVFSVPAPKGNPNYLIIYYDINGILVYKIK